MDKPELGVIVAAEEEKEKQRAALGAEPARPIPKSKYTTKCKVCGAVVSRTAIVCPDCRNDISMEGSMRFLGWLFVILMGFALVVAIGLVVFR
jgi:hypothetical protein